MKIYTKNGDCGTTSLVGGTRVEKCHPRVMAYGDLDELISYLGLIRAEVQELNSTLRHIQEVLMNVSAHLASDENCRKQLKPINIAEIEYLEKEIDRMYSEMPPQNAFILPSSPRSAALCHIARTICRRGERSAIAIENKTEEDMVAIKYINRLSDYLFALGRYRNYTESVEEDFWLP